MKNINKNRIRRNIVLIGMPASGKSTIGKLLAQKINCEYYDVDRYLEKKENGFHTMFKSKDANTVVSDINENNEKLMLIL